MTEAMRERLRKPRELDATGELNRPVQEIE